MAKNFKLNSTAHYTKSQKIARNHVLKAVKNADKTGLTPSPKLTKFGKNIFGAIVKNNDQLNSSDRSEINLLCHEYEIYIKAMDYIAKHGLVENGKKSPYYSIMKQSTDEIIKLSQNLGLQPKDRINHDMHAESNHEDPVKAVLR